MVVATSIVVECHIIILLLQPLFDQFFTVVKFSINRIQLSDLCDFTGVKKEC